jgi:hypothetical protein
MAMKTTGMESGNFALEERDWSGTVVVRLSQEGPATLAVFDAGGRRIAAYDLGPSPGESICELGRGLASGIYFIRLQQGRQAIRRRIVLLR